MRKVRGNTERLVAQERAVRDGEADVYDQRSERLGWELSILDGCYERLLALTPESTVLGAGCGTGRHIPWLLERAGKVIGVDHSPRSLERTRERFSAEAIDQVSFVEADLRALPLQDASVDCVLSSEVLSFVPGAENRERAVHEMFRVLRPGGVGVISGYHWLGSATGWRGNGFFPSEHGRLPFHAFTSGGLRKLLSRAGFDQIEVGGAVVLPSLAKRAGVGRETQIRLAFTGLRCLARWVVARGRRSPASPAAPS